MQPRKYIMNREYQSGDNYERDIENYKAKPSKFNLNVDPFFNELT